jgi:hypothetical protein
MAQTSLNSTGVASSGSLVLQSNGTTAAVTIDTSQNMGLGVTPSAWFANSKVVQFGLGGVLEARSNFAPYASLNANSYINSAGNDIYINTAAATQFQQDSGSFRWKIAASGTAGNAITFTQAMTLDASGNLGIGTTSTSRRLSVTNTASDPFISIVGAASNEGGLLFGDNASDAAGQIRYLHASDTMYFSTNLTERARIDSSGNLLVGTTSNAGGYKINIDSGSATSQLLKSSVSCFDMWNSATAGNNTFGIFYTETSATTRGSITYNRAGGLTVYNTTSDYRAKTVNGSVQNALQKIAQLKPSTGRMNDAEQDIDFFVAHELQEVVPSAVTGEKDAVNEDGTPNYQMVDKSALIPLLTAAIQEQQALITQLQADVAALKV